MSASVDFLTPSHLLPVVVDRERRFGGVARLYGKTGADRIAQAHAVVVGIGGVGSWAVETLARTGIGRLTLIDMDHVAESNINRQIHAGDASLGQAKIEAMQQRIAGYHPECQVDLIDDFVTADNWEQLVPQDATAVIDACDQMGAKTAMAAWARRNKALFVSVGAAGGKQQGHLVEMDDLSRVTHDPLLAQLRYRLRKQHGAPRDGKSIGVSCVFSREAVQMPAGDACAVDGTVDGSLNCAGYGSAVAVTATFGMCAAGWILKKIAEGLPKPR